MHTHLASASAWAAADCAGSAWQKAYLLRLRPYTTASTALPPGSVVWRRHWHAAHLLPGGRPAQRASDPVAAGICTRGAGHPRHLSVIPAPATGLAPAGGFSGGAVQRGPRAVGPAPQGLKCRRPPPLRPQAGVKHASSCSIQRVFSASLAKLASKLFLASCCQVAASNWNAACTARILSFR